MEHKITQIDMIYLKTAQERHDVSRSEDNTVQINGKHINIRYRLDKE